MLHAFVGASNSGDEKFLISTAIPAVLRLSWVNFKDDDWRVRALECMMKWASPRLSRKVSSIVDALVASEVADKRAPRHLGVAGLCPSNVFDIANVLGAGSVEETPFASAHLSVAQAEGLPSNPAGFGPRAFLRELKRVRVDPAGVSDYLESACRCLALRSN